MVKSSRFAGLNIPNGISVDQDPENDDSVRERSIVKTNVYAILPARYPVSCRSHRPVMILCMTKIEACFFVYDKFEGIGYLLVFISHERSSIAEDKEKSIVLRYKNICMEGKMRMGPFQSAKDSCS